MIQSLADPKQTVKPPVRCDECDRIVTHYNTFISPTNEVRNICWECLGRREKGFFTRPGFGRGSRRGFIPR